jgi:uncharacterized protein (TIGR01777 family)
MKILIAGGTGLIGRQLIQSLIPVGHSVVLLSRSAERLPQVQGVSAVKWDGKTTTGWGGLMNEVDAVINLAGENLGSFPWTENRKRKFRDSRVAAGKALSKAIEESKTRPGVFIQASAMGFYGPRGEEEVDESTGPGIDFSSRLCIDWEESSKSIENLGIRRVIVRTGIVLARKGGILHQMALPARLFVGGRMGDGKQGIPWIHIEDEINAIIFLNGNTTAKGVFNLSAPEPVSNAVFTQSIASVLHRPYWFHAPKGIIKLVLGEMSTFLLDGHYMMPRNLMNLGFPFKFKTLKQALDDLLSHR